MNTLTETELPTKDPINYIKYLIRDYYSTEQLQNIKAFVIETIEERQEGQINTLTETILTPELKAQLYKLSHSEHMYDELEERLLRLDYEPENMTSGNDSCYCLAVYYAKGKYVNVYIPNCEQATDEEEYDTYAVQCGETFSYLYESKDPQDVVEFIQSLK